MFTKAGTVFTDSVLLTMSRHYNHYNCSVGNVTALFQKNQVVVVCLLFFMPYCESRGRNMGIHD
jgi:hypothetical protein